MPPDREGLGATKTVLPDSAIQAGWTRSTPGIAATTRSEKHHGSHQPERTFRECALGPAGPNQNPSPPFSYVQRFSTRQPDLP